MCDTKIFYFEWLCILNIALVLNYLDWTLADAGYRFARYADDFVIVCSTKQQAQGAQALVQHTLKDLGLALSPEKTRHPTNVQRTSIDPRHGSFQTRGLLVGYSARLRCCLNL